jgi:hypothetical protein
VEHFECDEEGKRGAKGSSIGADEAVGSSESNFEITR